MSDSAVRKGTRAVLAAQIVSQVIGLGVLAVLYREVSTQEFGLLGMAVPLLTLTRMVATLGLNVATVQRTTVSDAQVSFLFWVNLGTGIVAAALTAAGGPLLAWLYDVDRLTPLCAALAGTLVLAALGAQHQALIERRLRLGRLAVVRLVAQAAGGAAGIGAALSGWGVWSLVVQQYAELVVLDAGLWVAHPWLPGRPRVSSEARELLRTGGYFSLSNLVFFVAHNVDKVMLAYLLRGSAAGQAMLGMYTQAFNLMMRPVLLVITPIAGVMLPGLSRAADERSAQSRSRYQQLVVDFYRMIGIVLLPSGMGLWLVAADGMVVLGGPEWTDAGKILTVLAPAIMVQGWVSIAGSVFASAGRTDRLFHGSLVTALLLAQGYAAGYFLGQRFLDPGPLGPALGVAAGFTLVTVTVLAGPYLWFCFATVGVSYRAVLSGVRRAALAAAIMGVMVFGLRAVLRSVDWVPELVELIALIGMGVIVYVLVAQTELKWLRDHLFSGSESAPSPPAPLPRGERGARDRDE